MPRVSLKKDTYMAKDLGKLVYGSMKLNNLSQADMGLKLGITGQWFGKKLKTGDFTYRELLIIFKTLGFSDEEKVKLLTL